MQQGKITPKPHFKNEATMDNVQIELWCVFQMLRNIVTGKPGDYLIGPKLEGGAKRRLNTLDVGHGIPLKFSHRHVQDSACPQPSVKSPSATFLSWCFRSYPRKYIIFIGNKALFLEVPSDWVSRNTPANASFFMSTWTYSNQSL